MSLVNIAKELLGRKGSGCGLENQEYVIGIHHADHMASSISKTS
jgi:hypothetical protein